MDSSKFNLDSTYVAADEEDAKACIAQFCKDNGSCLLLCCAQSPKRPGSLSQGVYLPLQCLL
jgi:hypothetical protein